MVLVIIGKNAMNEYARIQELEMQLAEVAQLRDTISTKYRYVSNTAEESVEQAVEQIARYYENIIDCMPGNVYVIDKNLICVTCNQNVLDMFGLKSVAEFKGLTFEQMGVIGKWGKEAEQSFKRDTLAVILSKQAKLNVEEPPIPNAGRMTYFLSSRVPLFDQRGEVLGI